MSDLAIVAPVCVDTLEPGGTRFGGGIYSASAAAALGFRTRLVGHVGEDQADAAAQLLNSSGVDTTYLHVTVTPTRSVSILHPDELLEQQTIVTARGDCSIIPDLSSALLQVPVVLTYGHCLPLGEAALSAAGKNSVTAIDLQDLHDESQIALLARKATWTLISEPSAAAVTGEQTSDSIIGGLWELGATNIVLKLGPGGALIVAQTGEVAEVPAYLGDYRDTVGAGDVFNAVFLCEYTRSSSVKSAGQRAALAASFFIASNACEFATPADLDAHVRLRVPVYSPPESRARTRVRVLMMSGSPAEVRERDWLDSVLANHSFTAEFGVPTDPDPNALPADVTVGIVSGANEAIASLAREWERKSRALLIMPVDSDARAVKGLSEVVIANRSNLLMCLYAVSSGGSDRLNQLLQIIHRGEH